MKHTNQYLAGLQHKAWQPRLAAEANDVEPDTKIRKRMEGTASADRAKHEDSFSARVDDDPTSLAIFGMIAESPAPEE